MTKPTHFRVQTNKSKNKGVAKSRQPLVVPIEPSPPTGETRVSPTRDADRLKRAYTFEYRLAQENHIGKESTYTPSRIFDERGVWREGAEMLRAQGLDPVRYIRVLFRSLRSLCYFCDTGEASSRYKKKRAAEDIVAEAKRQDYSLEGTKKVFIDVHNWTETRPPTPGQIFGQRYQKMFRKELESGPEEAALERTMMQACFKRKVSVLKHILRKSDDFANVNVLLDESLELGALARYSIAMKLIRVPETSPEQKEQNDTYRRIADRYKQLAFVQFMHNEEGYREVWADLLPPSLPSEAENLYECILCCLKL